MIDLRTAARLLGGEVSGRGIVCPGPGHSSRDRSLSILFSPSAPGGFVVRSHAGDDDLAAKDHVRQRLGITTQFCTVPTATAGERRSFRAEPAREALKSQGIADHSAAAHRIWGEARDPAGTPVEAYLARRDLVLPAEPGEVVRYHPACPFAGSRTPAMVALVRNIRTDAPQAIHRTALSLEGGKIRVAGRDRAALGPLAGGAVKLTPDAEVATCLGIGEGIESTLSLSGVPEYRGSPVWALLNTAGLAGFLPLPGIECLWIAVDHDPAGEKAASTCAGRWRFGGSEVFLVKATEPGSDLNDLREVRHG